MKVKICGLMSFADVEQVNEAMVDYAGFVFAAGRHQISPVLAKALQKTLRPEISAVGVFVDETPANILKLLEAGCIDSIQLHGNESPQMVMQLKENIKQENVSVIKAIRMGTQACQSPKEWKRLLNRYQEAGVDYFLFDSPCGGSGQSFAWETLPESPLPFFLAGGLHAGNLAEAIQATHPFAVDISSGAETDGVKDGEKIRRILQTVRENENLKHG